MTSILPPGSDPETSRSGERLYIHESVVISVEHRKAYLQHFTDVWGPRSRELYGMRCFGVWATSGSTGPWPEAIVMWELEGTHHLTGMMTGEFDFLKDPVSEAADHFEQFWATAPPGVVPTSGFDRLLIASAASRPIEELVAAGVRGEGYYHQIRHGRPWRRSGISCALRGRAGTGGGDLRTSTRWGISDDTSQPGRSSPTVGTPHLVGVGAVRRSASSRRPTRFLPTCIPVPRGTFGRQAAGWCAG